MANTDLSGFVKIIKDFLKDILLTFPEFEENLNQLLQNVKSAEPDDEMVEKLYEFCNKRYPERFFDILYQNDKIFEDDKTIFFNDINPKAKIHILGLPKAKVISLSDFIIQSSEIDFKYFFQKIFELVKKI